MNWSKKEDYKGWKRIDPNEKSKGGGQGEMYIVERNGVKGALKILKQNNYKERRARMFREASSLETINHPNIPKLLDSNKENYLNLEKKLFIVSEYIEGPTLEEFLTKEKNLVIEDSIKIGLKLLEIIKYCHDIPILHRDIKDANIIFRNGDIYDPVLLDFGISFNQYDNLNVTDDGQHLGNRSIFLPELVNGNKNDFRSDLTQICGLIFQLYTGEKILNLYDDKDLKPHQRPKFNTFFDPNISNNVSLLYKFFEIAFNNNIMFRWQSIESIVYELNYILESNEIEGLSERLNLEFDKKMKDISESDEIANQIIRFDLLNRFEIIYGSLHSNLSQYFQSKIFRVQVNHSHTENNNLEGNLNIEICDHKLTPFLEIEYNVKNSHSSLEYFRNDSRIVKFTTYLHGDISHFLNSITADIKKVFLNK